MRLRLLSSEISVSTTGAAENVFRVGYTFYIKKMKGLIHVGTYTMEVVNQKRVFYFKGEFLTETEISQKGYKVTPAEVPGYVAINVYESSI